MHCRYPTQEQFYFCNLNTLGRSTLSSTIALIYAELRLGIGLISCSLWSMIQFSSRNFQMTSRSRSPSSRVRRQSPRRSVAVKSHQSSAAAPSEKGVRKRRCERGDHQLRSHASSAQSRLTFMTAPGPRITSFLVKLASRCNLDCDYCYVYHHADQAWRAMPRLLSGENRAAFAERLAKYVQREGIKRCVVISTEVSLSWPVPRPLSNSRSISRGHRWISLAGHRPSNEWSAFGRALCCRFGAGEYWHLSEP